LPVGCLVAFVASDRVDTCSGCDRCGLRCGRPATLVYNNRRGRLADAEHTRRFGGLFAAYKPKFFFWQTCVLLRCVI
jgi:hypothetical protein